MGNFAVNIRRDPGWPADWSPKDLETAWHAYLNTTLSAVSDALIGAPDGSAEAGVYRDTLARVSGGPGQVGFIATADAYLLAHKSAANKASMMNQLLTSMDGKLDLLQNHAELYLRKLELESIFAGRWTPPTNTVPPAHAEPCNPYNNKHFGTDKKAAMYLGRFESNLKLVHALEEKAIADGLEVPGSSIFRFDENIGWDSLGAKVSNTACIRVDSIGAGQHSHPLPETGDGHVSHQNLVTRAIVEAVESRSLDDLVGIAKYLTTIRASAREFCLSGPQREAVKKAAKLPGGMDLPVCKFWS